MCEILILYYQLTTTTLALFIEYKTIYLFESDLFNYQYKSFLTQKPSGNILYHAFLYCINISCHIFFIIMFSFFNAVKPERTNRRRCQKDLQTNIQRVVRHKISLVEKINRFNAHLDEEFIGLVKRELLY